MHDTLLEAEALLRKRALLLDSDKIAWGSVTGFPEFDLAYLLNPAGGPIVGGSSFLVDVRKKAVYKASASIPPHLVAEQIKLGRRSPI